jgi:hypothetical protein
MKTKSVKEHIMTGPEMNHSLSSFHSVFSCAFGRSSYRVGIHSDMVERCIIAVSKSEARRFLISKLIRRVVASTQIWDGR